MKSLDVKTRKQFPWVIILALVIAVALIYLFDDPLEHLRVLLAQNNFGLSSGFYTFVLALSVVFSPFTIAPVVPFVSKILGPLVTFILTIIGWNIGASIAFFIARYGKEGLIQKVYPLKKVTKNQYRLSKKPSHLMLLQTRLFAAIDNYSYFLGLKSDISYTKFIAISLLGSIPSAYIFSFSADAIADGDVYTLFVLLFATALIALSYIMFRGIIALDPAVHIHTERNSFRSGEVMAVAALIYFSEKRNKRYKVIRNKDIEKATARIEKREGRNREEYIVSFDDMCSTTAECFSAQSDGKRGNNIPYGAFGSVWKKYGSAICESQVIAEKLDTALVSGIDAEDIGISGELDTEYIEQWSLSEILEHNFIDTEITNLSDRENYDSFMLAVDFAKDFLDRAIRREREVLDKTSQ
jgi:uncharacterized membrane protein YdjX (TVP38/TMEM64 family)